MIRYFLTGLVLLVLARYGKAQTEAKPMTVQECVKYALSNKPSVQNAIIEEQIAQRKIKEILGIAMPQVNGSIQFRHFAQLPVSVIPDFISPLLGRPPGPPVQARFGTDYDMSIGAELSQLAFDGTYFVGLEATKALVELARLNISRSKIETATNVTKAYYTVLASEKKSELLQTNLERVKQLYANTEKLVSKGVVEKIDLERIKVTQANLEI
ncbi:MAG: TolC family protein, partial [Bacteroidia bacterium]|nr:TolC family protein [Bacteroidia bacterium]